MQVLADDGFLLFQSRIVDDHLEHETVDLCLRQLIGTFLLDRVLSSHDEERVGQGESLLADGHLMLLHCLKQSALHLGRSTVDLISQHEVGEDRTFLDLKVLVFLGIDHCTYHVGRQQIGCKLYPAEVSIHELRECLDGEGLCQARYALQQDVAVAEQRNEQRIDQMLLTDDDLIHSCH